MFGKRLTSLRKMKKLTQSEMASILGVARTTYSSYEQGRRTPDVDIQNKIADYFDVSLDYLHGRSDESQDNDPNLLVAAHIDDDVSEQDMEDILRYIEYRKNNPLPKK